MSEAVFLHQVKADDSERMKLCLQEDDLVVKNYASMDKDFTQQLKLTIWVMQIFMICMISCVAVSFCQVHSAMATMHSNRNVDYIDLICRINAEVFVAWCHSQADTLV